MSPGRPSRVSYSLSWKIPSSIRCGGLTPEDPREMLLFGPVARVNHPTHTGHTSSLLPVRILASCQTLHRRCQCSSPTQLSFLRNTRQSRKPTPLSVLASCQTLSWRNNQPNTELPSLTDQIDDQHDFTRQPNPSPPNSYACSALTVVELPRAPGQVAGHTCSSHGTTRL